MNKKLILAKHTQKKLEKVFPSFPLGNLKDKKGHRMAFSLSNSIIIRSGICLTMSLALCELVKKRLHLQTDGDFLSGPFYHLEN